MVSNVLNEEVCCAKYVESYIDAIENLPEEVQRKVSTLRELDIKCQGIFAELEEMKNELKSQGSFETPRGKRLLAQIKDKLIECQDAQDEKMRAVEAIDTIVDNKNEELNQCLKNWQYATGPEGDLERGHETPSRNNESGSERNNKRPRRTPRIDACAYQYNSNGANSGVSAVASSAAVAACSSTQQGSTFPNSNICSSNGGNSFAVSSASMSSSTAATSHQQDGPASGVNERNLLSQKSTAAKNATQKKTTKKKKRKARVDRDRDDSPPEVPIDPDEPTYCLCEQVSYGEMIGCDNDLCPIEWFHFSCVNLTHKPKGKWYCPKCRGDKPTVMKPRAQFLRELEKYNKEREERS